MYDAADERCADMMFEEVRNGSREAFASWLRLVERPLRDSLRGFARQVDTEAVLQEGMMRMWVIAPTLELSGPDASVRYARRMLRNLAISWVRKHRREVQGEVPDLPDPSGTDPVPDMVLRKAVETCLSLLKARPRNAIMERLRDQGASHDRDLAERAGMTLNTFLQNVVRARRFLRDCLRSNGVSLEEYLP